MVSRVVILFDRFFNCRRSFLTAKNLRVVLKENHGMATTLESKVLGSSVDIAARSKLECNLHLIDILGSLDGTAGSTLQDHFPVFFISRHLCRCQIFCSFAF